MLWLLGFGPAARPWPGLVATGFGLLAWIGASLVVIDGVGAPDSHAYDATVWVIAGYMIFHAGLALLVKGCMGRAGPPAPCRPGDSESCGSCGYGPTMPRWPGWSGWPRHGCRGSSHEGHPADRRPLHPVDRRRQRGLRARGDVCSRHGLALAPAQGRLLLVT